MPMVILILLGTIAKLATLALLAYVVNHQANEELRLAQLRRRRGDARVGIDSAGAGGVRGGRCGDR